LAVRERKLLGVAPDELDARRDPPIAREARMGRGEHLLALVEPDHAAAVAADELARHQPGAGGDVKHRIVAPGADVRNELAPPPRVLSEAQQRAHEVVLPSEAREERERVRLARAERGGYVRRL